MFIDDVQWTACVFPELVYNFNASRLLKVHEDEFWSYDALIKVVGTIDTQRIYPV